MWLGEILNKRKEIQKFLSFPEKLELKAVLAIGKPGYRSIKGKRKILKDLIV